MKYTKRETGVLLLALALSGLTFASVASPSSAEPAAHPEPERMQGAHHFAGTWAVQWCDKAKPDLECGGFNLTLVQQGDRLCGSYGGALANLRQVDEGGVVGTVVGDTAVMAVESSRNGGIVLARAQWQAGSLHWKQVDEIHRGGTDIAIIADDAVLLPTAVGNEQPAQACMPEPTTDKAH